ncbi:MAG: type II secretion system F family protein [Planctomycetales bacterium]|nr:type II secretion system F family protein [Planctomycetales bacterium]
MARRKRYALAGTAAAATSVRNADTGGGTSLGQLFAPRGPQRLKSHEATFLLRNLATLVGNGVSLPRALATLAKEDSLAGHRKTLEGLHRRVESGSPFSAALADCPHVFDRLAVSQIRIAERSGTLADTLKHLAENRDKFAQLRQELIKKLAYPALLMVLGTGLVSFLMLYVVPVFEQTYADAGVPLPLITRAMITIAGLAKRYLWIVALAIGVTVAAYVQARKTDSIAEKLDGMLLRMPLFGDWLRDMAVLRVMDVLHNLMASGFTLVEALRQTSESAVNRAVRRGVLDLQLAVQSGERFSREIEKLESLFPPIVYQLVVVGESTGQLTKSTKEVCEHLRREIERRTSLMVGMLEPLLTISLAAAIAVILLAIYLPMFDMINTVK